MEALLTDKRSIAFDVDQIAPGLFFFAPVVGPARTDPCQRCGEGEAMLALRPPVRQIGADIAAFLQALLRQ